MGKIQDTLLNYEHYYSSDSIARYSIISEELAGYINLSFYNLLKTNSESDVFITSSIVTLIPYRPPVEGLLNSIFLLSNANFLKSLKNNNTPSKQLAMLCNLSEHINEAKLFYKFWSEQIKETLDTSIACELSSIADDVDEITSQTIIFYRYVEQYDQAFSIFKFKNYRILPI